MDGRISVSISNELGFREPRRNLEESMTFGMMVAIYHTNKFRDVVKMNYAFVGQRSRSK